MKKFLAILVAGTMLLSVGCGKKSEPVEEKDEVDQFVEMFTVKELPQLEEPKKGETVAIMQTNMGDIKIRLFPEYAPKAVENFLTHAQDGYYDGVVFHRVINDFMIQTGDPTGTGAGGESIWGEPFEDEFDASLRHFRGALSMANPGSSDSNGSQFFIVQNSGFDEELKESISEIFDAQEELLEPDTENPLKVKDLYPTELLDEYISNGGTPHLDFSHTVFGQVYEGMDIVDAIAVVEVDASDKPLEDVVIETISVEKY